MTDNEMNQWELARIRRTADMLVRVFVPRAAPFSNILGMLAQIEQQLIRLTQENQQLRKRVEELSRDEKDTKHLPRNPT